VKLETLGKQEALGWGEGRRRRAAGLRTFRQRRPELAKGEQRCRPL